MSDKIYTEMVKEIDESGLVLCGWELKFISDLIDNPVRYYSEKQKENIERIYKRL